MKYLYTSVLLAFSQLLLESRLQFNFWPKKKTGDEIVLFNLFLNFIIFILLYHITSYNYNEPVFETDNL